MKYSLLLAVVGSLLLTGCDDLFDPGHTDRTYDGPDQVAFGTLNNEINEGETQTLEVQIITSEGVASSDITVDLSVGGSANSDYYSVSSTSPTIPSGEASTTITIETEDDPDLGEDEEATIEFTIDSAEGAEVAPNLSNSILYVGGV